MTKEIKMTDFQSALAELSAKGNIGYQPETYRASRAALELAINVLEKEETYKKGLEVLACYKCGKLATQKSIDNNDCGKETP